MDTQTKTTTLKDFLAVTSGSKEIGFMIAKDNDEVNDIVHSLELMAFKKADAVQNLFNFKKSYLIVNENLAKDVYDFAAQYPTGQVEIFDKKEMKSEMFSPDYGNLNLVLLIAKDVLGTLDAKGIDLRSVVGPAFQL